MRLERVKSLEKGKRIELDRKNEENSRESCRTNGDEDSEWSGDSEMRDIDGLSKKRFERRIKEDEK